MHICPIPHGVKFSIALQLCWNLLNFVETQDASIVVCSRVGGGLEQTDDCFAGADIRHICRQQTVGKGRQCSDMAGGLLLLRVGYLEDEHEEYGASNGKGEGREW